ncbi:MAG TPA: hypothetical protein VGZ49_14325 [Xanthobacteraceae bacterium]|nr:hypothetical protein [Xanthobacteraceae bacterium]
MRSPEECAALSPAKTAPPLIEVPVGPMPTGWKFIFLPKARDI